MPRIPGQDEYKNDGGDFTLLASDEYKGRIEKWEEKDALPGKFTKEGDKSVWFFIKPLAFADDEEADLVDENGGPVHPDRTLVYFYDPQRTGIYQGRIARSRKFLAAALSVPVEESIEFDGYDDLVGKEIIVSVIKKDGKNRIEDVRPVRNRKRGKTPAPVAAAKEVFKDEVATVEDTEDEEY